MASGPPAELTDQPLGAIVRRMRTTKLDLSGLLCPLPALKTRKRLKRAALGDRFTLAIIDIPNLVNATGDLIERRHSGRHDCVCHPKAEGRAVAVDADPQS
jgi:tRNA 2-thiouridine synthesizing protein A